MITFDDTKRQINLDDHGVDIAALETFFGGDLLTREDRRVAYGEQRYQSVGWFGGEMLFVVRTPRHEREASSRYLA